MFKKNGFTITELLAVIILISVIFLIGTPIIFGIIERANESNRENTVKVFAKEVINAYWGKLAEDEFYAFDSEEKGGITAHNIINFTNEWINENVLVDGISCNSDGIYSNVFFDVYFEIIELTGCTVDGVEGYNYIDGKVLKD